MWNKILEAIVTGTAAATTWASLVWLYTFGKNITQERSIKKSFAEAGIGSGIDGFSVSLANHTKKQVRVREVALYTQSGTDVILSYTGTIEYDRKLDLKTLGLANQAVMFGPRVDRFETSSLPELDIESQATWLMPNKACLNESFRPIGGYCIVDFQTLFGPRRALNVLFNERTPKDLGTQFDHHRNECLTNDFMKPYIK
jgi:hypothetical protein